jgi:hypothetical protein
MIAEAEAPMGLDDTVGGDMLSLMGKAPLGLGAAPQDSAMDLAKNTVVLSLSFSRFGTRRKVDPKLVKEDVDPDVIHMGKEILESPELKAIQKHHGKARNYVARNSLGSNMLRRGYYMLSMGAVEEIDAKINEFQKQEEALVAEFLGVYPQQCEAARIRLTQQGVYNSSDYPTPEKLKQSFGIRHRYVAMGVPDSLKNVSEIIYAREIERQKKQAQEAMADIQQGLRQGMQELVAHLVERLQPSADGKVKKFKHTTVDYLKEFLHFFDANNLTQDEELQCLADKAKKLMAGVSPDLLKKNQSLRSTVLDGFSQIQKQLDTMVVAGPSRKIRIVDDEDE